jgi:hypothetical protein
MENLLANRRAVLQKFQGTGARETGDDLMSQMTVLKVSYQALRSDALTHTFQFSDGLSA